MKRAFMLLTIAVSVIFFSGLLYADSIGNQVLVINDEDLPVPVVVVQDNGDKEIAIEVCLDDTDCFEAEFVSSGISNSLSQKTPSGRTTGRSYFEDITVKKFPDRYSPLFFRCASIGEVLSKPVEIKVEKNVEGRDPYVTYTLTEVFVTKVNQALDIYSNKIFEEVSFSFSKFCIEVTPYKDDGTSDAAIKYCYDIAKMQPVEE